MNFKVPILFLIFNRPDETRKVFESIKKQRPSYLYIAADGPRKDKTGEKEVCEEVRKIVLSNIDWGCEVKTLLRDENLGCGKAPAEAITWFFSHVEHGIILEDDCLPDPSFFNFCEVLLEKYASDERVFMISGTNPMLKLRNLNSSYFFSNYAGIWGWASWKRAWEKYDYAIRSWEQDSNKLIVSQFFRNENDLAYYRSRFDETMKGNVVSWWDYQWFYTRIKERALGIIPAKNLISNIGFGAGATHTIDGTAKEANLSTFKISKMLIHPPAVEINEVYENSLMQHYAGKKKKLLISIKEVVSKSYKAIFNN